MDARVLFIAEAPGRLGSDRTGIPLNADRSGRDFDRLLRCAGLTREGVFVTNAVLCNPRNQHDRNRPPQAGELANCRAHLTRLLDLLKAPLVVTLGAVALRTLEAIEAHGLVLARDVGRPVAWRGRTLVPLYHPGAQAQISRPFNQQRRDYEGLSTIIRIACPSAVSLTSS